MVADDVATVDERGPSGGSRESVITPEDIVYAAEVRRSRVFASFICGIATVASLTVVFMPGDPFAKRVLWAGCGALVVGGVGWLWRLRDPTAYSSADGIIFGYLSIAAIGGGFLYFGPYSGATMLVSLGGFMFSHGQSRRAVIAMCATICVVHATIGGLVAFDVMDDRGIVITRPGATVPVKVAGLVLIQAIIIASFILGRVVRRATLDLIARRDEALQRVAQREALLEEARLELAGMAQRGDLGRFSDLTVGSYKLGRVLGRGASGEVYEAVHTGTGEPAAVKLLNPAALGDANLIRRFLREIELAAALGAANTVRVLEVSDASAPIKYIAMERLDGPSLSAILREKPAMPAEQVAELVDQLAAGIAAAHQAHIIHRDLKPSNIVRHQETEARHVWKIVDFGVSKLMSHEGTLTEGRVVGTPGYMAPEQARGLDVDARADLYALAAVAYRVVVGRPPFSGPDVASTLYAVVHTMPLRPSRAAGLPAAVDAVLAIGLAKRAEDRFPGPGAFARALRAALAGTIDETLDRKGRALMERDPWRER